MVSSFLAGKNGRTWLNMTYVNRWSVLSVLTAALFVTWCGAVPALSSVGTWAVATVGAPIFVLGTASVLVFGRETRPVMGAQRQADVPRPVGGRRR